MQDGVLVRPAVPLGRPVLDVRRGWVGDEGGASLGAGILVELYVGVTTRCERYMSMREGPTLRKQAAKRRPENRI